MRSHAREIKMNPAAQEKLHHEVLRNGTLRVMPADFYRQFAQDDLSGFCLLQGCYCLPTLELLDKINELILEASSTRSAIEIGSGNGVLGKGLGITCTDNHMQSDPAVKAALHLHGQPAVSYGAHVVKLDALSAVEHYRPEVVVAAWVTHRFKPAEAWRGGNVYGVDEEAMLKRIKRYVFVANDNSHLHKPLLATPHRRIEVDYLFSRGQFPEKNAILVWENC